MEIDHNSVHGKLAISFANCLVAGQYEEAYSALSPDLQEKLEVADLEHEYAEMTDYGAGPAELTELMATSETWPGREPDDIGWAYVAISGDGFNEGIAVVVSKGSGVPLIRTIEWGRP